jgi:hypothetical protein
VAEEVNGTKCILKKKSKLNLIVSEKNRFGNQPRVARCVIFKPKIPIWVNFGGQWIRHCRYILWPFGIFYRH